MTVPASPVASAPGRTEGVLAAAPGATVPVPSLATPVLQGVTVRLARPDERRRWDDLMDQRHYPGFEQFAGRGLRYVAEWNGRWLALPGWQTGAFSCAPRDKWLGWHRAVQYRRLHPIGNNTRFLVLPEGQGVPNLASRVPGRNLRRLGDDWERAWGHPLLVAETFVDPSRFRGTCYRAANWIKLGLSKGYARSNGKFTDRHGQKKVMLVYPLQAGARELLAQAGDRPEWHCKAVRVRYANEELRSLRSLLDEVEDGRGRHGKRHSLGAVLALQLLSRMAGHRGGRAAETFCQTLSQEELRAPGCRWSRVSRRCETPSDTTFQRVMADTGPASLERVAQRWTQPRRREAKVLAADGKRIRGANRLSPEGLHWETVTLVDHAAGVPVASRSDREEGGEQQALRDWLEEVDLRGRVITLDAGHAGKEIQEGIVKQHGGDVVVTLKGNCPETCATLRGLSRAGSEYRAASEEWTRSKGRWERRSIGVFPPLRGLLDYPCAQQAWRLQRETRETRNGPRTVTHACGVTSLLPKRASAADLPGMLRRHWEVENGNHYRRDVTPGEDRSRFRTGHGPAVNAARNNLVPALTPSKGETDLPAALITLGQNRSEAAGRLLRPD